MKNTTLPSHSPLISSPGTFVVTGASRGLGLGTACLLAARGHDLVLTARNEEQLRRVQDTLKEAPGQVRTVAADITNERAATRAFDKALAMGPLRGVLNNAGVLEPMTPVVSTDVAAFARAIQVNVLGVLVGTKLALQGRSPREPLRIVNISSGASTHGYRGWGAYCSSKGAVNLLTEVTALENPDATFCAVAVAPGVIETAMQRAIRGTDPAMFPDVDKFVQMKRSGSLLHPVQAAVALVWMLEAVPFEESGKLLDVRSEQVANAVEAFREREGEALQDARATALRWFEMLEI